MAAQNDAVRAFREYLAVHPALELPGHALDEISAELAAIAIDFQQPPLTVNGYQLLDDALNSIAPQRSVPQLSTKVCIHPEPTCTDGERAPTKLHCWLADYPKAGSIELSERDAGAQDQPAASQDPVVIAMKLTEAARWVYDTPSARKQPDALALAKAILRLVCPLIDAKVDSRSSSTT